MMTTPAQWHKQADQLALAGEVNFDNVITLRYEAETWLSNTANAHCTIDFSGASSNSAGIALMISLHRYALGRGKQLNLEHIPANLTAMAHLAGLEWLIDNLDTAAPHQPGDS